MTNVAMQLQVSSNMTIIKNNNNIKTKRLCVQNKSIFPIFKMSKSLSPLNPLFNDIHNFTE